MAERYAPAAPPDDVVTAAQLDRRAAAALSEHPGEITYVRTWFLRSDETCLSLFEAPSAELVRAAGDAVGVHYSRITEVVEAADDDPRPGGG